MSFSPLLKNGYPRPLTSSVLLQNLPEQVPTPFLLPLHFLFRTVFKTFHFLVSVSIFIYFIFIRIIFSSYNLSISF